jgi:uncharacterized membrane protein
LRQRTLAFVSTYHWLLTFHITGAFLLLGGSITAGVLHLLALRTRRPSELMLLLRLIRFAVPAILIGSVLTLVLGLWLVHNVGYSYGAFWVWGAIVLWVLGNFLGQRGGAAQAKALELAETLAAGNDEETPELHAAMHNRTANLMSWGSELAIIGVLVLMIWKPGQ